MLIEPTPIAPAHASRAGRAWTLATLFVPLALLAGVVGVAVAGPRERPVASARSAAAAESPGSGLAASARTADPTTAGTVRGALTPTLQPDLVAFPSVVGDLPVGSVAHAVNLAWGLQGRDAPIAVRGWFTFRLFEAGCEDPATGISIRRMGDTCWHSGILTDAHAPSFRWQDGTLQPIDSVGLHLVPKIPPGVALWDVDQRAMPLFSDGRSTALVEPIPVVMIGQFQGPGAGASFIVQDLVWTEGTWHADEAMSGTPGFVQPRP